jgi:hypothetical protein
VTAKRFILLESLAAAEGCAGNVCRRDFVERQENARCGFDGSSRVSIRALLTAGYVPHRIEGL